MKEVTKEILEKYVKLVDEANLLDDEIEFDDFCDTNLIDSGLCYFLSENKHESLNIIDLGMKIIEENYLKTYEELEPLKYRFWFWVKVYQSHSERKKGLLKFDFKLKKQSLLARQQVILDILEKHF